MDFFCTNNYGNYSKFYARENLNYVPFFCKLFLKGPIIKQKTDHEHESVTDRPTNRPTDMRAAYNIEVPCSLFTRDEHRTGLTTPGFWIQGLCCLR